MNFTIETPINEIYDQIEEYIGDNFEEKSKEYYDDKMEKLYNEYLLLKTIRSVSDSSDDFGYIFFTFLLSLEKEKFNDFYEIIFITLYLESNKFNGYYKIKNPLENIIISACLRNKISLLFIMHILLEDLKNKESIITIIKIITNIISMCAKCKTYYYRDDRKLVSDLFNSINDLKNKYESTIKKELEQNLILVNEKRYKRLIMEYKLGDSQ